MRKYEVLDPFLRNQMENWEEITPIFATYVYVSLKINDLRFILCTKKPDFLEFLNQEIQFDTF